MQKRRAGAVLVPSTVRQGCRAAAVGATCKLQWLLLRWCKRAMAEDGGHRWMLHNTGGTQAGAGSHQGKLK